MISVPYYIANDCLHSDVQAAATAARDSTRADREVQVVHIDPELITDEMLESLLATAEEKQHRQFVAAMKALISTRAGKPRACPNRWAAMEFLRSHLELHSARGWVYWHNEDLDVTQAYRVDQVAPSPYGSDILILASTYMVDSHKIENRGFTVDNPVGLPETVLRRVGLMAETDELLAAHLTAEAHAYELLGHDAGTQLLVNGPVTIHSPERRPELYTVSHRKMVLENQLKGRDREGLAPTRSELSGIRVGIPAPEGTPAAVPMDLRVRVFDLSAEQDVHVSATHATKYIYDDSVRDKIVLPETHSRIINVLTGSTHSTLTDVIHGKGAGNLILCKGQPGLGKTMTPEVVAEVLHRPLYVVDASTILAGKSGLRSRLDAVFNRVRRWDGVLLFDEADVVVGRRGDDMERNRVTAELLRALESYERIAFLTTNRPDDIDPAILSRCVAIIGYTAPSGDDAKRVWKVLADQIEPGLVSDTDSETLTEMFVGMAPRDIRQLLRLTYQVMRGDEREFSPQLVEECSVFRAWEPVL